MVPVPAGTFAMGEKPARPVIVQRAFYIDRTEVRADAYAACVEDGACSPNRVHTGDTIETAYGCNTDKERPKHPANCVDRAQAEKYCAFVRKRLPTEAEWEYAARGTDGRDYPWGNAPPTTCSMAILTGMTGECGDRKGTWEVGTTASGKSPFGALDMAGNVWEWVAGAAEPDGKGVLRGGSWDYAITSAKTSYRLPFPVTSGNVSVGFRCARDGE
jgi:eukaryotic-like serine/threonine-protein kinase